jgi:hypothetical protein
LYEVWFRMNCNWIKTTLCWVVQPSIDWPKLWVRFIPVAHVSFHRVVGATVKQFLSVGGYCVHIHMCLSSGGKVFLPLAQNLIEQNLVRPCVLHFDVCLGNCERLN